LIASVFLPNLESKPEVNHRDGNKKNISVWNLEWVTKEENQRHAQIHGLGNVKLKPIEVENIFYLAWASDMTQEEIGNLYGVRRSIVSDIKNRKSWEFVTDFKVQHEMGLFE
ncbi:HNH endonuclease, partial [Bacillus cereus]